MLKKICLAAILIVAIPGWAQPKAQIHGHVQDPLSMPVANAKILVANATNEVKYTFTTDANGNYTGDVAPGTYTIMLQQMPNATNAAASKAAVGNIPNVIDIQRNIRFAEATDTQVNFDLSRKEFLDKLSPAARKAVADAMAKNAAIIKENAQIKNVNGLILQARAARQAGNVDQAITLDQQATQIKPDSGLLWYELGDSDLAAKKYADAVTNYQKALGLLQADKNSTPEIIASADNNLGEAYAKSGKNDLSVAAYEAAVKAQPTNAAMYYGNEAVVLYQAGQSDAAGAAADKAIAADPAKPMPYYIKGQSLIQKATVDPKTQKIVLPPGCADAYQKFLELAPNSPLANDVRSVLTAAGETIHSTYKKGGH